MTKTSISSNNQTTNSSSFATKDSVRLQNGIPAHELITFSKTITSLAKDELQRQVVERHHEDAMRSKPI